MANRPNIKAWSASTNEELLARHGELVAKLQDPAYAGVDPSTVKSGSPMHVLDRGTLNSLEAELDKRGATYTPSRGTIIPMPGTTPASAIPTSTSAASTTPPPTTPAPPDPPATGSPSVRTLEPSDKPVPRPSWLDKPAAPDAPQPTAATKPTGLPWLDKPYVPDIPQEPTLPDFLTGQAPSPTPPPAAAAPTPQPVAPTPQPTATVTPRRQIPLGQPVQAAAPTSAPTATTKPVGRPVISVTASPPPPTGAGAQQASAQVTQTGNATPKPVAKVTATVQNTPPAPAKVVTSGAPTPRPFLKKTGDDISKALLGGTKGTRNIKLAGAAALLGLGAYTVNKKSHQTNDDYDRKLEMQRRGMMM